MPPLGDVISRLLGRKEPEDTSAVGQMITSLREQIAGYDKNQPQQLISCLELIKNVVNHPEATAQQKTDAMRVYCEFITQVIDIRDRVRGLSGGFFYLDFHETNLSNVDLSDLDLTGFNFDGADLTGAKLNGTTLHNTRFFCANLTDAQIQEANLSNTNFKGAILSNTDFADTDILAGREPTMNAAGAILLGVKNFSCDPISQLQAAYRHEGIRTKARYDEADTSPEQYVRDPDAYSLYVEPIINQGVFENAVRHAIETYGTEKGEGKQPNADDHKILNNWHKYANKRLPVISNAMESAFGDILIKSKAPASAANSDDAAADTGPPRSSGGP